LVHIVRREDLIAAHSKGAADMSTRNLLIWLATLAICAALLYFALGT
jgi:hypothetical protein